MSILHDEVSASVYHEMERRSEFIDTFFLEVVPSLHIKIMKRGYTGTYHHMSKKHLQRYVNEFAYRWNARAVEIADLFAGVVQNVAGQNTLSYKSLTA